MAGSGGWHWLRGATEIPGLVGKAGAVRLWKPSSAHTHRILSLIILTAFLYVSSQLLRLDATWDTPSHFESSLAGARVDTALAGCPQASSDYAKQMQKRGFDVERITVSETPDSRTMIDALRMHYRDGFRATSNALAAKDAIRKSALQSMRSSHRIYAVFKCPYWLEAARVRAFEYLSPVSGVSRMEGFSDVVARCTAVDSMEMYLETDVLEQHVPMKVCGFQNCLSRSRPACRRFIEGAEDASLPIYHYQLSDTDPDRGESLGRSALPFSREIQIVDNPDDACLFFFDICEIDIDTRENFVRETRFEFSDLKHWTAVDGVPGRNHILWHPSCGTHCDFSASRRENGLLGEAVVVSPVHWQGMFRPGFDIAIPTHYKSVYKTLVDKRTRRKYRGSKLILFFRGGANGHTKWDLDRMVAAGFSNWPEKGVMIQSKVRRQDKPTGIQACDEYVTSPKYNTSYVDLMTTTPFAFCPGGGGPYSFRLVEAIASGAIPVVPEDLILPFEGIEWYPAAELWRRCAVFVSPEEMYALRVVVSAVYDEGEDAFIERQRSCQMIWDDLFVGDGAGLREQYMNGMARSVVRELKYRLRR